MGLFGKPRQLKKLDKELMTIRVACSLFARLPDHNKQRLIDTGPREVQQAVAAAVRAGQADGAKRMLDEAASRTPDGATEELWRAMLADGFAALDGR